ncbi:16S rRNA (cytosine(1402)-N(4))-methyltransferase [Idiomarina tyrosinivorans]|uniref:Ribosomal RNA small subunit methyltransferase H n=1 Tax=Idiomarina tyrosinivorans TaxID=1445662 RepID=A0A432ZQH0_9GAMM|nr:16S rRNA (cytosine(1402)-N(4))-methyltransferase RsmH [Idiomarina tyrosinivorans]RUO80088.1 16S rRNA (cytosine(1402)-N(4))-methyltransferase [Idiomarina tyrosinivorans]
MVNDATPQHISVLLEESIDALAIRPDGTYLDATFGRGGHSRAILAKLNENGRLIALDRDPQAIAAAELLRSDPRFEIFHTPFAELGSLIEQQQLENAIDGVLFDLGVSSPQLDDAERGFSFMRDGPLDMRMDTSAGPTAAEWLAEASEDDITWVLKTYGEERFARKIARAIVHDRQQQPYTRTKPLADMIARVAPSKDRKKHAATRSFQAIRIHINGELDQVAAALTASLQGLKHDARLAVISFHSLEDRLVKQFIRAQSQGKPIPAGLPITDAEWKKDIQLNSIGKAIKPSAKELQQNPRARSSVLRIARRVRHD